MLRTILRSRTATFGTVLALILLVIMALAPWLAPQSPTEQRMTLRNRAPSAGALLGTDSLGRDILSRMIWGARLSLSLGFLAVLIGTALGVTVGLDLPPVPTGLIEGFKALTDLTGTVSDVLDKLGIAGTIPATVLPLSIPGSRIVGPALTVRNVAQEIQPHKGALGVVIKLEEMEAHNLAKPGDVLVIQGLDGISNMGGLSASTGQRQGEIGAIVDGGVRDVDHQRKIGYPVWSRSVSPITGKWRIETVQINGPVNIAGVRVNPGDLVLADDTGICFVPLELAETVLAMAQKAAAYEDQFDRDIAAGVPVLELLARLKGIDSKH